MKAILHLEEVLVDDNHLTIKDQKLLEEEGQMDHLIEILELMDLQVMEDILQDMDRQEVDHQEEDHLVPLAHLEILDPQEIRDLQAPWTTRTQRTSWTTRTYGTPRSTWTNHETALHTWNYSSITGNDGYHKSRKNFSWHGQCCRKTGSTTSCQK